MDCEAELLRRGLCAPSTGLQLKNDNAENKNSGIFLAGVTPKVSLASAVLHWNKQPALVFEMSTAPRVHKASRQRCPGGRAACRTSAQTLPQKEQPALVSHRSELQLPRRVLHAPGGPKPNPTGI